MSDKVREAGRELLRVMKEGGNRAKAMEDLDAALDELPAPGQSAEGRLVELSRVYKQERNDLGMAIAHAAMKAGIIRGEVELTGPMLVMLCDHLADMAIGRAPETHD